MLSVWSDDDNIIILNAGVLLLFCMLLLMVELPGWEWEVFYLFPWFIHLYPDLEVGVSDILPLEV